MVITISNARLCTYRPSLHLKCIEHYYYKKRYTEIVTPHEGQEEVDTKRAPRVREALRARGDICISRPSIDRSIRGRWTSTPLEVVEEEQQQYHNPGEEMRSINSPATCCGSCPVQESRIGQITNNFYLNKCILINLLWAKNRPNPGLWMHTVCRGHQSPLPSPGNRYSLCWSIFCLRSCLEMVLVLPEEKKKKMLTCTNTRPR